jgi:hypothetical protein
MDGFADPDRDAHPCAREQGCATCGIRKGCHGISGLPCGEECPCKFKSLSPSGEAGGIAEFPGAREDMAKPAARQVEGV